MSDDANVVEAPPVIQAARQAASPTTRRLIGAVVAAGAVTLLGIATFLEPSPTGLGTHTQLTSTPCGWILTMNMPCPTCGMTTAFAHAANGNLLASFLTQPLGCILSVATAAALLAGVYVAATGSRLGSIFARMWGRRMAWILAAIATAAWIYKVMVYRGIL